MEPKVLFVDIETAPLLVYTWGIHDQNVGLSQIVEDWSILSFAAKFLGSKKLIYQDTRKNKNIRDDSKLLPAIWNLLNETDILVTQNGRSFDQKKLNARFKIHGMQPPKASRHIDTKLLAKKHFGFTSSSLEYMSDKINTKYKKLKHTKYPGQELWTECLKGNNDAWNEMEKYNKHDVLALEELYTKLIPWDTSVSFSVYSGKNTCSCGSTRFHSRGYYYTNTAKYRYLRCTNCGACLRLRENEIKGNKLAVGVTR